LKKQLEKILKAEEKALANDHPHTSKEMKGDIDITENEDDGTVVILMTCPEGPEVDKEEAEMKKALKLGKPKLTGKITLARTFEQILEAKKTNIISAVRGVEVKLSAVILDALMLSLADMPQAPPGAKAAVGLVRKSKIRTEMYYDKDTLPHALPLPLVSELTGQGCSMLPPEVGKTLKSLTELDEVKSMVLQGLPYKLKLALTMKNFKPTPLVSSCAA